MSYKQNARYFKEKGSLALNKLQHLSFTVEKKKYIKLKNFTIFTNFL